ncbi:hypothetical protein [Nonomuraea maheshkhaliensis]|uniref:hypothetical protein n=1 Tax=Nonomuraea maheshkhaliensis TaxID=419590 RepID=UPI0031F891FD
MASGAAPLPANLIDRGAVLGGLAVLICSFAGDSFPRLMLGVDWTTPRHRHSRAPPAIGEVTVR